MTGIFKANNPSNNFLLFIYGLLLKLPVFLNPSVPVVQQPDGLFYTIFLKWLQPIGSSFPMIYPLLTFVLLYTQALMLNKVVSGNRLLNKPGYLTAMSYLLITSLFSEWFNLSAPLMINTLMIWILSELCKLNNHPNPKTILFNIGIVTGIAAFFYFPSIAFLLLIIVGLIITRPFQIPEWLMVLLGILTPYYLIFSWFYLTDRTSDFKMPHLGITVPALHGSTYAYIAIAIVIVALIIGVIFIQMIMRRQLVQTRKNWGLVFLYLLVSLFVPFLNKTNNFDYWILSAIPVSVIVSASFLYPERKWFSILIHWSLVALVLIMAYL
ncbi:MAG: DUF6427 family protein [Ferruginibacter sp.]